MLSDKVNYHMTKLCNVWEAVQLKLVYKKLNLLLQVTRESVSVQQVM